VNNTDDFPDLPDESPEERSASIAEWCERADSLHKQEQAGGQDIDPWLEDQGYDAWRAKWEQLLKAADAIATHLLHLPPWQRKRLETRARVTPERLLSHAEAVRDTYRLRVAFTTPHKFRAVKTTSRPRSSGTRPRMRRERRHVARSTSSSDPGDPDLDPGPAGAGGRDHHRVLAGVAR
jgi:hypothetical protein